MIVIHMRTRRKVITTSTILASVWFKDDEDNDDGDDDGDDDNVVEDNLSNIGLHLVQSLGQLGDPPPPLFTLGFLIIKLVQLCSCFLVIYSLMARCLDLTIKDVQLCSFF